MVKICQICNCSYDSEEALNQHNLAKHKIKEKKKINFRKYAVLSLVVLIMVFSLASVYSFTKKPGQYNEFAKCLTERGAVIYGNDFCQYTAKQLNYFGKSKEYLNYIKCIDNKELCDSKGIKITPTWEINGEMYKQVQTFERLSVITGCQV